MHGQSSERTCIKVSNFFHFFGKSARVADLTQLDQDEKEKLEDNDRNSLVRQVNFLLFEHRVLKPCWRKTIYVTNLPNHKVNIL